MIFIFFLVNYFLILSKKKKNKSGKKDTCEIGLESERKGKRGKRELLMVMREGGIQRWMVSWGSWT